MSDFFSLHCIHISVPGSTGDSPYLELFFSEVFHTAGSVQAAAVLVAKLSIFT